MGGCVCGCGGGFFCLKQRWPLKNPLPAPALVKGVRTSLPKVPYLLAPSFSAVGLLLKALLPLTPQRFDLIDSCAFAVFSGTVVVHSRLCCRRERLQPTEAAFLLWRAVGPAMVWEQAERSHHLLGSYPDPSRTPATCCWKPSPGGGLRSLKERRGWL